MYVHCSFLILVISHLTVYADLTNVTLRTYPTPGKNRMFSVNDSILFTLESLTIISNSCLANYHLIFPFKVSGREIIHNKKEAQGKIKSWKGESKKNNFTSFPLPS
uniref:Uncharacterized protein n=1 Tax=Cacopsylla melanoneura TaxID=428564 RepID=A0A8D9EEP0_9HEMI